MTAVKPKGVVLVKAMNWPAALLVCLLSGSVQAQCYNRVYYAQSPTYYYQPPTYQAPRTVKYYPGWTYNYSDGYYYKDKEKEYVYPVQKVVANEVQVAPLIVTVPVASAAMPVEMYGPRHYYTAVEAYQQKAQIRDIIREELRSALVGATTATLPPVAPPVNPSTTGRGAGTPAVPVKWEADTLTGLDVQNPVIEMVTQHCGTCHTSGTSGGIKLLVDGPGGKQFLPKMTKEQKWTIYGVVSTGVMPPEAAKDASKAVPNEKLPSLLRWVLLK